MNKGLLDNDYDLSELIGTLKFESKLNEKVYDLKDSLIACLEELEHYRNKDMSISEKFQKKYQKKQIDDKTLIAAYSFEIYDAGMKFTTETEFYKTPFGTYEKHYYDNYYERDIISTTTLDEIKQDLQTVKETMKSYSNKQQQLGKYSLEKDIDEDFEK